MGKADASCLHHVKAWSQDGQQRLLPAMARAQMLHSARQLPSDCALYTCTGFRILCAGSSWTRSQKSTSQPNLLVSTKSCNLPYKCCKSQLYLSRAVGHCIWNGKNVERIHCGDAVTFGMATAFYFLRCNVLIHEGFQAKYASLVKLYLRSAQKVLQVLQL